MKKLLKVICVIVSFVAVAMVVYKFLNPSEETESVNINNDDVPVEKPVTKQKYITIHSVAR